MTEMPDFASTSLMSTPVEQHTTRMGHSRPAF